MYIVSECSNHFGVSLCGLYVFVFYYMYVLWNNLCSVRLGLRRTKSFMKEIDAPILSYIIMCTEGDKILCFFCIGMRIQVTCWSNSSVVFVHLS
jgi:hypothetical protein